MENQHPLSILWSGRWLLVVSAALAAVAGYVLSDYLPERYKAEALAQVVPRAQASGQALTTDQLLQTTNFYSEFARTTPVERRAERLARAAPGSFDDAVDVEARPDLLVLAFSASAETPRAAERRANAYARAFADFVAEQQTAERSDALRAPQRRVAELQEQLDKLGADGAEAAALNAELQALQTRLAEEALTPGDSVRVIQPALAPAAPDEPKPVRNGVLAAIAALVLAACALLARAALSDRYASIEEAALDLRLAVLGEVPQARRDAAASIEAFRKLRTRVVHALPRGGESCALLVTSPEERTGKSHIVFGLARALAWDGSAVVAIDADLRRPTLNDLFGVQPAPGLGDALDTRDPLPVTAVMAPVPLPDAVRERGGELAVVPAGRHIGDSAEVLSGRAMGNVVDTALASSDFAVLDSPPVLAIADAAVVARHAGAVLLVVDLKRSRRRTLRRAVQALRGVEAPLIGMVHNRAKLQDGGYGYYGTAPPGEREDSRLVT